MKKYLFLILSFFSLTASAENWLNDSKIIAGSVEAHSIQKDCENISGEKCYELGNYPSSVYSRGYKMVDDTTKPIYEKSQEALCSSTSDCNSKLSALTCPSFEKVKEATKVYCQALTGYEKKQEPTIVLDSSKVSQWEAAKTLQYQKDQAEAYVQLALKKIACGERVIALLVVRNQPKGLTPVQIAQMNSVYAPIKGLLETASLVTAKAQIEAVTADGMLITEADKTALAAETQKCIDL